MRNNYKQLGPYIQQVNERNTDLKVERLLGVSIRKVLMPSIANTVGTNMKSYKIIKKNQFAYGPVTSRNGEKISVALLQEYKQAIVSQAYTVFEIINTKELDPEYLMMWFRRPEFDRYARYKSHGSARETFDWDELCETELPIPSIEKQHQIVAEYNAVDNRIRINEQLNQKLEETAQAIYKHWFVDNIKGDWKTTLVKDFCVEMKSGGTPSRNKPEFWNDASVPWLKTGEIKNNILISAKEFISESGLKKSSAKLLPINTVLMSMYGVNASELGILKFNATTNQACCGMICKNDYHSAFLYYHLLHNQDFIASQSIGGAQQNLSKNFIENIEITIPDKDTLESNPLKSFIDKKEANTRENEKLEQLKDLLLSKMSKVEVEKEMV